MKTPAKLWSFDQLDCHGGALHEYSPVAGFRMKNGLCVGLLTDSGYRNHWTRIVRRDGRPVKPAPRRIPYANLYTISSPQEHSSGNFFAQQTFGEVTQKILDGEYAAQTVMLPAISSGESEAEATLEERDGVAVVSTRSTEDGVIIPISAIGSEVRVRMEYRSAAPVALGVWR